MYHFLCALNFHRLEEHPQSLIILSFLFVIYVSYILDNMKNPCKFLLGPFNQAFPFLVMPQCLVWYGLGFGLLTFVFCLDCHCLCVREWN